MPDGPAPTAGYTVMKVSALAYAETAASVGLPLDGTVPFSVDAWVKFNGLCSMAGIFTKDGVFNFGIIGDTLVLEIQGFPAVRSDAAVQPLDDESWHYLCATYDGGSVRLYIDGRFNVLQTAWGAGTTSPKPFTIASDLQAYVRCVRVYNRALDGDTVMANMFNEPPANTIAASFDFGQAPPVDTGPHHLPIRLVGGAHMIHAVPSLALERTAYALPLQQGHVNPGGRQVDPYTVQAWVYVDSTDNEQQAIFVNSDLQSDTGMALYLQLEGDAFRVVSVRGANVAANELATQPVVPARAWVNVATTFDGAQLRIYVGGQEVASAPFGPIPLVRPEGDLLIGAALSQGQPYGASTLQGYVLRVDVWDRALSATEVVEYLSVAPDLAAPGLHAIYDFADWPARNRVDGRPTALADGAELSEQVQRVTTMAADDRQTGVVYEPLDEDTMAELLAAADHDLRAALGELSPALERALQSSLALLDIAPDERDVARETWARALRPGTGAGGPGFRVTAHRLGDERILICHSPRLGPYVGYRGSVDDIDECTMWKVMLIFTIVAGAIDALFSVRCVLGPRATDYVTRILRNPALAAKLALGSTMTVATLFAILVQMESSGYLVELFRMIVVASFWTVARIILRLALTFVGWGAAYVLVSLGITVASFILEYSRRPGACDPLPHVELAALKFDYDPTGAAVDALTLRRSFARNLTVPEWVRGKTLPEQSPVAYSIAAVTGKVVTVQAKLTFGATAATTVTIKAEGGGVLGPIAPTTVSLVNGTSHPEFVTLSLPSHQLGSGGIRREDVTWTWSYQLGSGPWTTIGATSHRVYAVLNLPTLPWEQSSRRNSSQLPWTDVLDHACVWAAGKTTATDAAAAVTKKVNDGIGLVYDTSAGATHYTMKNQLGVSEFQCTRFLDFLNSGSGSHLVNCVDCASIVATFANVLGCNLTESRMQPSTGLGFKCNEIIAIGTPSWAYPFPPKNGFTFHEVAWTGACSYTDHLFDACLQVDGSSDPWNWNTTSGHTPMLPTDIVFTTRGISPGTISPPFTDRSYRERLAQNSSDGIGACKPVGPATTTPNGRRRVQ